MSDNVYVGEYPEFKLSLVSIFLANPEFGGDLLAEAAKVVARKRKSGWKLFDLVSGEDHVSIYFGKRRKQKPKS